MMFDHGIRPAQPERGDPPAGIDGVCHIFSGIASVLGAVGLDTAAAGVTAALGTTAGAVGSGALTGAAIGAGTSALTGGNALTGALTGGVSGGLIGGFASPLASALNVSPAVASGLIGAGVGGAGAALTGGNPLMGALTGGAGGFVGSSLGSMVNGGSGTAGTTSQQYDIAGNPIPNVTNGTYDIAGNPIESTSSAVAANDANAATGNSGGSTGKSGIGTTALALGALAGVGSLLSKPKAAAYGNTPGPAQVAANTGPYFGSSLNTNVPGRTATNPFSGVPAQTAPTGNAYSIYGGPEQSYFSGNSLGNFGFAQGGATGREFTTGGGRRHVTGPGTGTSDSIPARLSDGEYVLTHREVSAIANGDNDAGARKLDRLRRTGALSRILSHAA